MHCSKCSAKLILPRRTSCSWMSAALATPDSVSVGRSLLLCPGLHVGDRAGDTLVQSNRSTTAAAIVQAMTIAMMMTAVAIMIQFRYDCKYAAQKRGAHVCLLCAFQATQLLRTIHHNQGLMFLSTLASDLRGRDFLHDWGKLTDFLRSLQNDMRALKGMVFTISHSMLGSSKTTSSSCYCG